MSRGPDRTFQGAASGPQAVVCPSLLYTKGKSLQNRIDSLVGPDGMDVLEESKISCPCWGVNYSPLVTQSKALSLHRLFYLHATFHLPKYTIFTQMQDEVFFLKFSASLCGVILNLCYEAPKWTAPYWITLEQSMRRQTKACIGKSSCVDKTEKRSWLKLPDTIFFLRTSSISLFREAQCFESHLCFCLQAKKQLTWRTL
jgi:hypothetical protein